MTNKTFKEIDKKIRTLKRSLTRHMGKKDWVRCDFIDKEIKKFEEKLK